MNQPPKVSIVMPFLNVAPYIRACLQTVVSQTLRDIEILCVDAGSDDGTLAILEEYAQMGIVETDDIVDLQGRDHAQRA